MPINCKNDWDEIDFESDNEFIYDFQGDIQKMIQYEIENKENVNYNITWDDFWICENESCQFRNHPRDVTCIACSKTLSKPGQARLWHAIDKSYQEEVKIQHVVRKQ